ncbi:LuxR C-terminal-related transcriptional regulator [Streptomyces sp. NPDC127190]|uniref:LuxR C-terminal-related transcriptional regulator n=1 Tax=unclassified Streptomyces TaxID=2593676 RepID=UPI003644A49C
MAQDDATSALSRYRVAVVADPFPVSRTAVASLLRHSGALDDAREADSGPAAVELVRRLRADLLVTDVDLVARGDGVHLCHQVKRLSRPPSVLVFTGADDPAVVAACLTGGADGFVHRSASPERLVHAVETLAVGRPVWYLRERGQEPPQPPDGARAPGMTSREQQVLGLLLARYSNDEIAAELHVARQTVKNHVSNVLRKLGVANRRELLTL